MENKDQPINPVKISFSDGMTEQFEGLTKREYFAGLAMRSIPHPANADFVTEEEGNIMYKLWAEKCIRMADELLKQLDHD